MYSANITEKRLDKSSRQFILSVEFTNGKDSHTEVLHFGADWDFTAIKRNLKERLDALNSGVKEESNIPTGAVDTSNIQPEAPTQDELDREAWVLAYKELELALKLEALGAPVATTQAITALRTKVKNLFKREYAGLIN